MSLRLWSTCRAPTSGEEDMRWLAGGADLPVAVIDQRGRQTTPLQLSSTSDIRGMFKALLLELGILAAMVNLRYQFVSRPMHMMV